MSRPEGTTLSTNANLVDVNVAFDHQRVACVDVDANECPAFERDLLRHAEQFGRSIASSFDSLAYASTNT